MTGDTLTAEPQAPATAGTRRRLGHPWWIALMSTLAAAVYATLGLVKLATFRATTFDLVVFDQVVRAYSNFQAPYAPLVGAFRGRGLDYLQLADHFSPIWAVLAPLYWIHDGPESLVIAQAALFAAAIPFLWMFTRRVLGTAPAYLVAIGYALSWPVAQAIAFDVHEVMFVPVLTAIMLERYHAGRFLPAFVAMFGLLLVKEDMGLLVIGFGLYQIVTGDRLRGLSSAAIGIGGTVLVRGALIPMAGGDTTDYWAYTHLGPDAGSAIGAMLKDPVATVLLPFSAEAKVDTLFLLAWPVLLLCLLSPLSLVALPHVLVRMLSDREQWWQADFHYSAFIVVIIFFAGVDGLARLLRWRKRSDDRALKLAWAAGVCVIALTLLPKFSLDQLYHPDFYKGDQAKTAAATEAVSKVPSGVTVEVVNSLGPALSSRTTVTLWTAQPHLPQRWVVADTERWEFPFGSPDDQRKRVEELMAQGYQRVFERDGYVVLHLP